MSSVDAVDPVVVALYASMSRPARGAPLIIDPAGLDRAEAALRARRQDPEDFAALVHQLAQLACFVGDVQRSPDTAVELGAWLERVIAAEAMANPGTSAASDLVSASGERAAAEYARFVANPAVVPAPGSSTAFKPVPSRLRA